MQKKINGITKCFRHKYKLMKLPATSCWGTKAEFPFYSP